MNCSKKDELLNFLTENLADTKHPLHVKFLSERLFDEIKPLHKMGNKEKDYLLQSAILHDIGFLISASGHHKHSMDYILNSKIPCIDSNKKKIIANIARYHRKTLPSPNHDNYNKLSGEDKKVVLQLASILRIADGLDRTHLSLIKDIKVKTDKNKILIFYFSKRKALPEEEATVKKSDLFELVFNRKVIVVWEKV